jgi:hypothetical protein
MRGIRQCNSSLRAPPVDTKRADAIHSFKAANNVAVA